MNRVLCTAAIVLAKVSVASANVTTGLEISSERLGRPIPYTVYEPQSAGQSRRQNRAVLYLLHGHGDDEHAWLKHGRIAGTLDKLIRTRRLPPLLVVMPAVGNSWYVDDARGGQGYGPVATAFVKDFAPAVERRHLRDSRPCRTKRAIGGLSMGGFGAVLYAFDHPAMFGSAISLSGSLFAEDLSPDPDLRRRLSALFGGVYGSPFRMQRFNAWNVFPRVARLSRLDDPPAVWLTAGDDDFPSILRGTVDLHLALRRQRLPSQLRIDEAGHTWAYWRKAIVPALEWLGPRLAGPCAVRPLAKDARSP